MDPVLLSFAACAATPIGAGLDTQTPGLDGSVDASVDAFVATDAASDHTTDVAVDSSNFAGDAGKAQLQRGAQCKASADCAVGLCDPYFHQCGEPCGSGVTTQCPAGTTCFVPGDQKGICLDTCPGQCAVANGGCSTDYDCRYAPQTKVPTCVPHNMFGGWVCP